MKLSHGNQLGKLFGAHLKMMFREKAVWFWNIFFPIILMVLFMLIFGGGGDGGEFKSKVAVVSETQSESSAALLEQLRQIPVLEWETKEPVSREQALDWIKDKTVEAAIVLPSGEEALELIFNTEKEQNAASQALAGIIDRFVQQANWAAAGIEPSLHMKISSVSAGSEDLSYVDFLLTGMIALSLAQGGLFGMVDLVEMRRNGLMKRLRMTPVSLGLFGLASMAVRYVLGIVQIVLLTAIGVFGFGANLHIDFLTLLVAFFVGSLAFNALGYLISSFSKSMEAYMGVANIASFLMMFLSGIFFPTNTLPEWLQSVTQGIPLTYFVNVLRDGMVYGEGFLTGDFWLSIAVLAVWGVAAFLLGGALFRRTKLAVR
ncbi:ABC transporter permease [Paenibacillus eucommiae]|uniref:Transport permease protein n=1 Tax=Paenibacillus eucommiae TaxID=1355755 RepID=A0ABS4INJ5_9BACL|nr:ABC transporter permease [Paenibacillus eucommiae]MBP1988735.1 ABC-2 type transport system permease protein [Paenibacillus eucommiae]